jgi:DNA binding domain, excisionase family
MNHEVMTVSEVAAYLRIKEKTAYRLVAEGKLPGFKVGGSWRFMRDEIEQWIREQSGENRPEEN